jgi:hypothetical protein
LSRNDLKSDFVKSSIKSLNTLKGNTSGAKSSQTAYA